MSLRRRERAESWSLTDVTISLRRGSLITSHRPHLHRASLVVAYERRPPLNGDGLRQRHSAVCLVPTEVLQAAGVCLLLPVLREQREE